MERLVRKAADFVKQYERVHPNDPDLPLMRQFAGLGNSLLDLRKQAVQAPVASTKQEIPTKTRITSRRETSPLVLKPIPFEIEIPTVSEEVYVETRRAVETAIPNVFIAPIRSATMESLLAEERQREQRGEPRRLGYVNDSKTMRATLSPAMEVFIDPTAIRIEGSNYLSTDEQKAEIAKVAARYRERLPEALRGYVDWHMVDPSTMSQLEDAWMDAGNGLLLPDFYARTDVETVGGGVAGVGRIVPGRQRLVSDWNRDLGYGHVFAVAVGVLPQKLAA